MARQQIIKILYFIPTFGTGGTERLVVDLCRNLDPDRFDAQVCVLKTGAFESELSKLNKRVTVVSDSRVHTSSCNALLGKVRNFFRITGGVKRLLKQEGVHILHTNHLGPLFYAGFVPLRSRLHVRWVHTEHIRPDMEQAYSPGMVRLCQPFLRKTDIASGVSEAVGAYFRDVAGVPARRVVPILNGVNVRAFADVTTGREKRREFGYGADEIIIGTVGNLRKQKNHRNLLKAFSLLCDEFPALRLLLCGDGECRVELEQFAAELGISPKVRFLGHRLDAPEVMSSFDLYCLPSFYEGMPLSIMEAWASGKPVIATDVLGITELVTHGVNGYLVPSDDAQRLAQGISEMIRTGPLREKLAAQGHAFALERCGIDAMVRRYEALYLKVMEC
jgi:L-malate glycosyltransferase